MENTVNAYSGRSKRSATRKTGAAFAALRSALNGPTNPLSVDACRVSDSIASPSIENTHCVYNGSSSSAGTSTATTVLPLSNKKFSELDDELQGLFGELVESEACFKEKVTLIKATDKVIFENLDKLECLHRAFTELAKVQTDVCVDLNAIRSYLHVYDRSVECLERSDETQTTRPPLRCVDILRKSIYNSVVQTNAELNFSTAQLANLIVASQRPEVAGRSQQDNPLLQIGALLNYHYECLTEMDNAFDQRRADLKRIQQLHRSIQRE